MIVLNSNNDCRLIPSLKRCGLVIGYQIMSDDVYVGYMEFCPKMAEQVVGFSIDKWALRMDSNGVSVTRNFLAGIWDCLSVSLHISELAGTKPI